MSVEIEKKKRAANSPLVGNNKEIRESEMGTSPTFSQSTRKSSLDRVPGTSYADIASKVTPQPSTNGDQPIDNSIFKTAKPQGAFRDEIVVEVNTIDGMEFRGTVTTKEAIKSIFIEQLGFERNSLGSMTIGYSKGRIITYKLLNEFDIDTLSTVEEFEFKRESKNRNGETICSIIGCKIRGIRQRRGPNPNQSTPYSDEGYRWVKIEGAEYRLERNQIGDWLSFWGDLESEITEDKLEFDSDDSEGNHEIGNGTYSVKMKLRSDLPQFLPMFGKRIRVYYRGIIKKCTNCFGPHARKSCDRAKTSWIQYVGELMTDRPDIPEEFYGKWAPMVKEMREETNKITQPPSGGSPTRKSTGDPEIISEPAKDNGTYTSNGKEITKTKATDDSQSNVSFTKTASDYTDVGNMDRKLLKLRGQGIIISTKTNTKQPPPSGESSTEATIIDNKMRSLKESSRGRGRRKTSLN
jgi:hypothetical protein